MAAPMRKVISSVCFSHVRYIRSGHYALLSTSKILCVDPLKYKTLRKLIAKDKRNRDKFDSAPLYPNMTIKLKPNESRPARSGRRVSEGMKKRARYLSLIVYESIAQIVGAGELGVYVEISKVDVLPDLSHVNVYWEGSGETQTDKQTQEHLESKAGLLRHTLQTSHAMGMVPKIMFVKDLSPCRVKEIEHLLSQADLGPPEDRLSEDTDHLAETDDEAVETAGDGRSVISGITETLNVENVRDRISGSGGCMNGNTEIPGARPERIGTILYSDSRNVGSDIEVMTEEDAESENVLPGSEKNWLNKEKNEDMNEIIDLKQDMYGLHHDVLMKKVIDAKLLSSGSTRQKLVNLDHVDRDASRRELSKFFRMNEKRLKKPVKPRLDADLVYATRSEAADVDEPVVEDFEVIYVDDEPTKN